MINSPCNDIWPTFPNGPEYNFILEFSNVLVFACFVDVAGVHYIQRNQFNYVEIH